MLHLFDSLRAHALFAPLNGEGGGAFERDNKVHCLIEKNSQKSQNIIFVQSKPVW